MISRSLHFVTISSLAMCAFVLSSSDAFAVRRAIFGGITSFQWELRCLRLPSNPSVGTCRFLSGLWDPALSGVTDFAMELQYDPSKFTFDQADSGPLGIVSVGGDAPAPDPGVGTEPVSLLPISGFSPGAPLPGSTLTYTNTNGLLTVNYDLGSPVTIDSDIDFFRTDFEFVHPLIISLPSSTITYAASGPGGDFSLVSFSCTSSDLTGGCASDTPSTGVTFFFDSVPERPTWALMLLGFVGLGLAGYWRSSKGSLA
jgi:hypothetical protein